MAPMGTMGPLNPQEVLSLPQILKVPSAIIDKTGIPDALSEVAADFRRRVGIDPSAQPGVPAINIPKLSMPIPGADVMRMVAPDIVGGIESKLGEIASGFTAPGMTELLPLGGMKPVQAAFGLQSAAAIPQDVEQVMAAKTPKEFASAATGLGANIGITASIAHQLLPRATKTLTEGATDAGKVEETPKVQQQGQGQVSTQTTPPRVEKQAPLPLKQEEMALLDAERKAIDTPVDLVEGPLGENEPFAGQIATIDRQTGRIRINQIEFAKWIRTIPEKNRQQAVRSLLSEEKIHLAVDDASAAKYWDNLTSVEKAIQRRRYTGRWKGAGFDDVNMGHEAVRFRMQQLARMTPREIAEAVGREKFTVQAITALESAVRSAREFLGTKASAEQLAILDRMQKNLDVAKAVANGVAPSSFRKQSREEFLRDVRIMEIGASHGRAHQVLGDLIDKNALDPEALKIAKALQKIGDKGVKFTYYTPDQWPEFEAKARESVPPEYEVSPNAHYNVKSDMIAMPLEHMLDATEYKTPGEMFIHEYTHGLTAKELFYNPDGKLAKEVSNIFDQVKRRFVAQHGPDALDHVKHDLRGDMEMANLAYAMSNEHELLAQAFSNPKTQEFLRSIPLEKSKNVWSALVEAISRFLGISDSNALERVLRLGTEIGSRREAVQLRQRGLFGEDFPSAYRKGAGDTSEQNFMFLPPVPKGEQLEREAPRKMPTDAGVKEVIDQAFKDAVQHGLTKEVRIQHAMTEEQQKALSPEEAAKVSTSSTVSKRLPSFPTLDEVEGVLKREFGPGISREAVYHRWSDQVMDAIEKAPGAEIDALLDSMELRGRLINELQQGVPRGTIADPVIFTRGQQILMPGIAKASKSQLRRQIQGQQRTRRAAQALIIDELHKEAGPKPAAKPWERTEVGPEEINEFGGQKAWGAGNPVRTFSPEEASDPVKVGEMAVANAAVEASGKGAPPRTVSKNVMAVQDKSGRIVLVSAWRDPRTGPKVTNPASEKAPGRRIDKSFLDDYTPVAVFNLRDPVQGLRQVFNDRAAFDKWFGDAGIEGTPGLKTSSFAGPQAGIINEQAGNRGAGAPPPAEAGLPPQFTEQDFVSKTSRELTARRRIPPTVDPNVKIPKGPGPTPRLPAGVNPPLLTAQGQAEAAARAAEAFPSAGPMVTGMTYGRPTGQIRTFGSPKPMGPGWPLRAGIERTETGRRTPSAINKQAIKDEFEIIQKGIADRVARRGVIKAIPKIIDGADGNSAMAANDAFNSITRASLSELPPGATKAQRRANEREAQQRRESAVVYIASGFTDPRGNWHPNRNRIDRSIPARGARPAEPSFEQLLETAKNRAEVWLNSPNPLKRVEAKKDLAYIEKLKRDLEYAKTHWNDPEFKAAAEQTRKELADAIDFETQNGFPTKTHENYIPGRYDGAFWNDNLIRFAGRKILGTGYKLPKSFANLYEAIANGPYRMVTTDVAKLVQHRIGQGRKMVEQDMAIRSLRNLTDPGTQKPVAMAPATYTVTDPITQEQSLRYKSPSPEYELIYPRRNGPPLAVYSPYSSIVKAVTYPSMIEHIPGGRTAIVMNQMLKHGAILLLDTFHPGRIGQYAAALNGFRGVGYKAGITALNIRPGEMAEAVRKGMITQAAADWASELIEVGRNTRITRQQLLKHLVENGLNAQHMSDALYRSAIQHLPIIGERYHKLLHPFNDWLFGRFIPGVIAESAVNNFEKLRAANPNIPLSELTKDVVTDVNVFFGNMGRQGILKSKTAQQLAQIAFLAPMWQEGLFQKEIRGAARFAGAAARGVGVDLPYRRGLPAMGALGEGMGKGILTYLVGTQLINLITRQKFTWENPEEGHKLDAYLKLPWMKTGVWLSPLSVFAEVTHDLIRLMETKPRAWDAIMQMGENRMSPVGKMALILATGESPSGQYYSTTAGQLWGAASQVVPLAGASPISFSVPAREIGSRLLPSRISPNPPGALLRQVMAAGSGTKTELDKTPLQQMQQKVREFMQKNQLTKTTGWKEVQTDDPSYSKLRSAIRLGDTATAKKMVKELEKNRSAADIEKAMKIWAKRPWTGSRQNDALLRMDMSEKDADLMSRADEERMKILNGFYDVLLGE